MFFIGIDLGSTNIKAGLYSGENLNRVHICSRKLEYARDGKKVEFSADAVFDSVLEMLRELGQKTGGGKIERVTLTGQAESLILLDSRMRPLRPALSWMDESGGDSVDEIASLFSAEEIYAVTGQKAVIQTWPAVKILHLSKTEHEITGKTAFYIMLKDYIVWRLCGVMAAEKSIATFSLYFDIHNGRYWDAMLRACGIRNDQVPSLVEPCTDLGCINVPGLGIEYSGTIINTGTLDHFAGMIGNGITKPGTLSESCGTVLALAAFAPSPYTGGTALHYGPFPGTKVLLPVAESGGIPLEWFKNNFLNNISYEELEGRIMRRGQNKLIFLPYIVGVSAPEFDSEACGLFFGLHAENDAVDMARSVMEGTALLLERNLAAMRKEGMDFSSIISTGGAAKSDLWCQIKADISGREIRIPGESDAACFGAAIIGAVKAGFFNNFDEAASVCVKIAKHFYPNKNLLYEAKKKGFDVLYTGMMEASRVIMKVKQEN